MENILEHIVGKISSYNIFNNLYPGIIFCYLLKIMFQINILVDNWFENLIIFYFVGMVLSRVGSIIIEPVMKKIKIKKAHLLKYAPYKDYERASTINPLIATLSEVNNTYRTLLSCFACASIFKIIIVVNDKLVQSECNFLQANRDWFILISLVLLFANSYIKQTNYVRKRIESLLTRIGSRE